MGDQEEEFPQVQGGGSLILAWQIKDKRVLIVGGGEVAAGRILNCLNADALVTIVCPSDGLNPEVRHRLATQPPERLTHVDRVFQPTDLDDPSISLVMTAIDDPVASTEIWQLCKQRRIAANIADVPPECDFYFGSVHRDGPLQIMVSTNGKGPRLAAQIRKRIAAGLPTNAGAAVEKVGRLRGMLRKVDPGKGESIPRRMGWMIRVSDDYSWETFCGLNEEDMENLLRFYPDEVPDLGDLKAMRKVPEYWEFDGSFGFSVGC
ncbi:unnamed protein product [Discula destructiva]